MLEATRLNARWLAALASLLVPSAARATQPVTVKMATLAPEGSPWHLVLKETSDKWKEASGGRVTVRLYPGGIAGDDPEVVRKMRLGTLDAGLLTSAGLAEIDQSVHAFSVPMMYASYEELDHVLEKMRPRLEGSLEARGFVVLNWADGGWVHFFTQRPVATPDDLRALEIFGWAGDAVTIEAWRSAGFHPVPLPAAEVGAALRKGLVSALGCPPQVAVITRYHDRLKNMTDLPWQPLLGATVISGPVWASIPADLRPRLLEIAREAGRRLRTAIRGSGGRDVETMRKRGLNVVGVDATNRALWLRAAESMHPQLRGSVVPAPAFDEAVRHRDEYRRQHAPGRPR